MAHAVEALDLTDSSTLRNYISAHPQPARELLTCFAAACYHMNGTRVVNCETGTDLYPLSDFKAADVVLAMRDAEAQFLSDESVFLKAFMGLALNRIRLLFCRLK